MNIQPQDTPVARDQWHIPWSCNHISLQDALHSLNRVRNDPDEIPLLIQLVENPKYRLPGISWFHGRVDLQQHDCVHILLGRGLLSKDEAFVIGFTMGASGTRSSAEENAFCSIARHLYPDIYQFDDEDISIFKDALRLAQVNRPAELDSFDFRPWMQQSLAKLRHAAGIDNALLTAYYRLEQQRYPNDAASGRLL